MPLKIRKLAASAALAACLLLSGCLTDMDLSSINPFSSPPPPSQPVPVTQMTSTAPATPGAPPLYCKLGRGSALFGREWYDFQDVNFSLQRGQPADIHLTRMHGSEQMALQALFDGQGQKLIFCPFLNVGPDQRIDCNSIYVLDPDLQDGIKRTFDIPEAVRGAELSCAYAEDHLRKLSVPSP